MELTSGQRKALFALVVLVLAGVGIYLVVPGAHGSSSPAPPARHSPATRHAAAAPTAAPSPVPASSAPDIYQWLPFTQSELASAAAVVGRFATDYGTWSYTEGPAAYAATMGSLITPQLSQVVQQGYAAPGVASARTSQKQVSTGTAVINSLRAYGSSSMTFVVTISQQIASTTGTTQVSTQYAVTVSGTGSAWQVSDIELASAGNS